jgi:hypothetical protein
VRIVLDTNDAEVLEVTLSPGDRQPVHSGRHRFVYSLSDYTLDFTCGGESKTTSFSAGDGHWHEAAEHCAENPRDRRTLRPVRTEALTACRAKQTRPYPKLRS